jgi:pyridoxine 4-dehydrogenase
VLSRGLIGGSWSAERAVQSDFRGRAPRFQGENLQKNLALVERLRAAAQKIGAPVSQVAIAWVAAQGVDIVPVLGARRRDQLQDGLAAMRLALSPQDLEALVQSVPADAVAGERYPAAQLAHMDSEK